MIKVSNILIKVSKKLTNDELLNLGIKKLVKKYHPDLHQGDKEAEENFKKLSVAYQYFLAKFS